MSEQSITRINSITKVTLGKSKIHGIGVIALRHIFEGEKLHLPTLPEVHSVSRGSLNRLFPEIKTILLERWPTTINNGKVLWPDVWFPSFLNHSDRPNYDQRTDTAIRDIEAGEEVTENYRLMRNWEKVFPWLKKESK